MKKCAECGINEIEDKYMFCLDCVSKQRENAKKEADKTLSYSFKGIPELIVANNENTKAIINQLEKNNNNLYNLVKCFSVVLEKQFSCAVIWDKKKADKKGDFVVKKLK